MPQSKLIKRLTLPENLLWAWEKTYFLYRIGDAWFNEAAVADFEKHLDRELSIIEEQFSAGKYDMSPLRPLVHPKRKDENGQTRLRQYFDIDVRDQVVWIAYINIVGPELDNKMMPWSYGHRLYRTAWKDSISDVKDRLKIGPYRHTTKNLYRKFKHSWPLYRRHINLTIKKMASIEDIPFDEAENRILESEKYLTEEHKLPYLKKGYWQSTLKTGKWHWGGIDLSKFYPSCNINIIEKNILNYSTLAREGRELLNNLLTFNLDFSNLNEDEIEKLEFSKKQKLFKGIPTGLFVAGFLANLALLEVDHIVSDLLKNNRSIAHFRFVDDHIFLSNSFEELTNWIIAYRELLREKIETIDFNIDKTQPKELGRYLSSKIKKEDKKDLESDAKQATKYDPRFPVPLTTPTLAQISNLALTPFDLLDFEEQSHFIEDLKHLMMADFPDAEIRRDTRMTFAASRLSYLYPEHIQQKEAEINYTEREKANIEASKDKIESSMNKYRNEFISRDENENELEELNKKLLKKNSDLKNERASLKKRLEGEEAFIHEILIRAINDYPDKIRLWLFAIQFCRLSGYQGIKSIIELLANEKRKDTNKYALEYLRAVVYQILSDQIAKAINDICKNDISPDAVAARCQFLNSLENCSLQFGSSSEAKAFFNASYCNLKFITGSAIEVLNEVCKTSIEKITHKSKIRESIKSLEEFGQRINAFTWDSNHQDWSHISGYDISIWVWLAEKKINYKLGEQAGLIWHKYVNYANLKNKEVWPTIAKYPYDLKISNLSKRIKKSQFKRFALAQGKGWLYDWYQNSDENADKNFVKSQLRTMNYRSKIDLFQWTKWLNEQNKKYPSDLRLSEWTALKIIEEIGKLLLSFKNVARDTEVPYHPGNFFIPRNWITQKYPLTWDAWRSHIESNTPILQNRIDDLIEDPRYSSWINQEGAEYSHIRGPALLLLALLRRSFIWPEKWNPPGNWRSQQRFPFTLLNDVRCSSNTTSLLLGSLTSRARETAMLKQLNMLTHYGEDDSLDDPEPIVAVDEFYLRVKNSRQHLEKYQLTVKNGEPVQLIPVKLELLTKPSIINDEEEE
ncbi:MAG TPA: RNA-directed DNA polymerase [archaeon]|nr:RNA-directed DNA polymerase [archaeon]